MDVCSKCEGVWLDGNEVKYFVEILPTAVEDSGLEKRLGGILPLINKARSIFSRILRRKGRLK